MTNEEKAKEIAIKYQTPCHGIGDCEFEAYQSAIEMAEWKDQEFAKQKQVLIDKACEWLKKEAYKHIGFDTITEEFTLSWDFLEEFKKAIFSWH